jgi:DNA-dependent RNA polymerase auxiliary subunit epsilon
MEIPYFSVSNMFLDIIHCAVSYLIDWAQLSRFYQKTETESSLRNVKFLNENRISYVDWAQLSMFYQKTETESRVRNVFLNKNRTMDNVQKHNTCIDVPSAQTFRC